MLTKITQITNLSRGKTTICDIVRSLANGDPSFVNRRISRVYPGNSEVTVQYGSPSISPRFASGSWVNAPTGLNCLVLDKDFIQRNIHTATVEHDHKKNLHGLIVGEGAIEYATLAS